MRKFFDEKELNERIELNYNRLANDPYYMLNGVFTMTNKWPGDKEGRSLLAFVSHYKINGKKLPCMEQMIAVMQERANEKQYFGPLMEEIFLEQQLSGHSWVLRGLCEYYEQFGGEKVLEQINAICENLYFPTKGYYKTYPVERTGAAIGEVSGFTFATVGNWALSTDIGCAFMSIDGLSHVYKITKNNEIKELLDEMIEVYLAIDKFTLKAQTHCTLSAARGMMRMYLVTNDKKYLDGAKAIYELYVNGDGMTLTYQNVNWWQRYETWTEPCAIIDSLMLALELYKALGDEKYRVIAARIYHNGFATSQRSNGGAGCETVVMNKEGAKDSLSIKMFEAFFCCTMRLSEGLWYINENKDLLYAQIGDEITKNSDGVYMNGDIIYAEVMGEGEKYVENAVEIDGHKLCPILKYYRLPREVFENTKQRIIF